jgi:hypothetical protein
MGSTKSAEKIIFLKSNSPGPYDIPMNVVDENETRYLFEIEIDDAFHSFPILKEDIVSSISLPSEDSTIMVELKKEAMEVLYRDIVSMVRSNNNDIF